MPPARVRRLRDTEIAAVFEESLLTGCLPYEFQTFQFAANSLPTLPVSPRTCGSVAAESPDR
jgi:hypothetical protein